MAKCDKYPCGKDATNELRIEHERLTLRKTGEEIPGEIEYLSRCDEHAINTYMDAASRLGGSVHSVQIDGPASAIVQRKLRRR